MYKKLHWVFIVVVLLGSCRNRENLTGSAENETLDIQNDTISNVAGTTTIQFAISEGERLYYEPLVESFEADNSDIQIHLVSIGEIRAAARETPASVALAEAADVFPSRFTNFGPNRASVTRDLTPFIQADPAFNPEDFYTDTLQELDGSIRVLPISVDVQLIYYNKDAFDATELAYPQLNWTWESFRTMVNALTIYEGEEVSQWGFVEPNARYFVEGQLDNSLVTAVAARFTDDDVVTAVRWYTDLFLADHVAPLPTSDDAQMRLTLTPYFASEEARQLISAGHVAMWSDSSTALSFIDEDRNVGVVPYPVSAAIADSSPIHIDGLVMSAGTTQPGSAWRWMDFLSRQNPADFGSNVLLPARVSVATASGFWNSIDPTLADALRFALEHQRPFPRNPIFNAFNQAINEILTDNQPVETALADVQASNIRGEDVQIDLVEPIAPPSSDESSGVESVLSIRFLPFTLGGDGSELEPFRLLANQFEMQNPGVHIELLEGNLAANSISRNFVVTAQNTECFQMLSTRYSMGVAEQMAVIPLDPFANADSSFFLNDIPQPLINAYSVQGKLRGVPFELYPYFIEYNKDLFDAANIAYPKLDWTTDDFLATAVALTTGDADNKQFGFIPHPYESQTLAIMLTQLGAIVVDTQVTPLAIDLTDTHTASAIRWYADLGGKFGVKPTYPLDISNLDHAALNELFQERRILIESERGAMWIVSGLDLFINPDTSKLNVGIITLPTLSRIADAHSSGLALNHTGFFISAAASRQQAQLCWEWLKFLSISPNVGQGIPARLSVVESDAYQQRVGAEKVTSYLSLIENMKVSNAHVNLDIDQEWVDASYYWLIRAYEQIVVNENNVEDALLMAQQTFDAYRACIIDRDAFDSREKQDQCAVEVDPSLSGILDISEE